MPYIGNIVQDFSVNNAMLNTDSVTSIKIDDGTIVNADINDSAAIAMSKLALSITNSEINASAAIAGTKISPVFGAQTITGAGGEFTGNVIVNGNNGIKVENTYPRIFLTDTDNDSDYSIINNNGEFRIYDDTNGANRLRIFNSGTVNIPSNTDFGAGIDVTGAITATGSVSSTDITVTSGSPFISFVDSDHDSDFNIQINAGSLNFNDTTNSATRMSITSAGNVGIGTSSPSEILHINSSVDTQLNISSDGDQFKLSCFSNGDAGLETVGSFPIRFFTASAERMRIDSSGNIAIGTTSTTMNGNGLKIFHTNFPSLQLQNNATGTGATVGAEFILSTGGALLISQRSSEAIIFKTANTERMRLGASGEVYIGTSNWPTGSMGKSAGRVMMGNEGSLTIWNETNSAGGGGTLKLACKEGSDATRVGFVNLVGGTENTSDRASFFKIQVANSSGSGVESMRIDSSGRVLIGNSSHVSNGGIESHLQLMGTGTDDTSITLSRFSNNVHSAYLVFSKSRNGSIGGNTIVQDGDSLGRMTFFGNDGTDNNTPAAEIDIEVDGTPGSNDMPGRIVFKTTQDGASATTERYRITNTGNLGWRNTAIYQRKTFFFVGQSGGTSLDTKISGNFGNNDMLRVQYAFNWNAGDGGAWGTAIIWKQYEGTVRVRQLGEELASPADSISFPHSGNDIWLRFTLTSSSGMNGYAYISVEAGGCEPFPF